MTLRYKASLSSEDLVTLPGSADGNGQPRVYRLRDNQFRDDGPGSLEPGFRLASLQTLPCVTQLGLHRWYEDLRSCLVANPLIKELELRGHHQARLDLSDSKLCRLMVDTSGLDVLVVPATLDFLSLLGAPGDGCLKIVSPDHGARLSLSCSDGFERVNGLSRLEELQIHRVARCDVAAVAQTFPQLRMFNLSGMPSFLDNASCLARLPELQCLRLFETFGFDGIPGPGDLPKLHTIQVSSLPADAAASIRKHYKSVPGVSLRVERPRKPEWLEENLGNPLRAWDGRDGISTPQAKKAFAAYKTAQVAMRQALIATDDSLQAEAERISRDFIASFNAMDARKPFIDTIECEEIIDALDKIWELLPDRIDRRALESAVDAVREF